MKYHTFLGWVFIVFSLLIGSLFTASWVIMWKSDTAWFWLIPCIAGIVYYICCGIYILIPFIDEYRRPRTQAEFDALKPYYVFVFSTMVAYVCLSITLGSIWVFNFKSFEAGRTMLAIGLVSLSIPVGILVVAAAKSLK